MARHPNGWWALLVAADDLAARSDERLDWTSASPYLGAVNRRLAVEQAVRTLLQDRVHREAGYGAARVVMPWLMRGYRTHIYLRCLRYALRNAPAVTRIIRRPHLPKER